MSSAWRWLALSIALTACARSAPQAELSALSPSEVSSAEDSVLTVHGERFFAAPLVELGSSAPARLNDRFRVRLGDAFETRDVERVDSQTLRFTLTAGLPPGAYDLEVFPPTGGSLRLSAALTVRGQAADAGASADAALDAGGEPDAGAGRSLQLEDAPGGAGRALDTQTARSAADELVVYAVLRAADGSFVADVAVRWSVEGGAGSDGAEPGTSLRLPLDKLGDLTVQASYGDLSAQAGPIHVVPGHARALGIVPNTLSLRTSDLPRTFKVTGFDALGNPTTDVGVLSWRIESGAFGAFHAASATLTPRMLGSGRISVSSGYGPKAVSGLIEVQPGAAAELTIQPNTLSLSSDDAPAHFTVTAYDALGNATTELGELSWSIASGSISAVYADGTFDPLRTGTGTVAVMSSHGASAESGVIEVRPGRAKTLVVTPSTWSGSVGDAPVTFSVTGAQDAAGNNTTDLGEVSYAIGSGSIGDIDPVSGVLTPKVAGDGKVSATSSYGASGLSGTVHIASYSPQVSLSALRVADPFWPGQSAARVEVDVKNDETREVVLPGMAWTFTNLGFDVSGDYVVTAARSNVDRVPASSTRTLVYWVDVASSADRTNVSLQASADVFLPTGYGVQRSVSTAVSHRSLSLGSEVSLTAPVVPANRVCKGGAVAFNSTDTALLSTSYAWRFPGGTPTSSAAAAPSVTYNTVGAFGYGITIIDSLGYPDTALGEPIFVGTVAAAAADTYPTGPIVVSAPSAGQSVSLASFPRSNLLQLSASVPVTQCNGSAVAATGHNVLTVSSDRWLFDPAADADPAKPGIQLPLTSLGGLGAVALRAPPLQTEGNTTLYLEYADSAGTVTAAGDLTFRLTQDTSAPRVDASYPTSDCGAACLARGEALLFKFSEPVSASSLGNVKVELLSSASCAAGVASDISGSATRRYDAAARTLFVTPAAQSAQSYALRVTLPASITDAASTPNALLPLVRCVIVSGTSAGTAAAKPALIAGSAAAFSPDGDGLAETTGFNVRAYADTVALRVSLSRGRSELRALLIPVPGPGSYTLTWDGTDGVARVADPGMYRFDVTALNRSGTASAAVSGFVELQSALHMVGVRRRY